MMSTPALSAARRETDGHPASLSASTRQRAALQPARSPTAAEVPIGSTSGIRCAVDCPERRSSCPMQRPLPKLRFVQKVRRPSALVHLEDHHVQTDRQPLRHVPRRLRRRTAAKPRQPAGCEWPVADELGVHDAHFSADARRWRRRRRQWHRIHTQRGGAVVRAGDGMGRWRHSISLRQSTSPAWPCGITPPYSGGGLSLSRFRRQSSQPARPTTTPSTRAISRPMSRPELTRRCASRRRGRAAPGGRTVRPSRPRGR